MKSTTEPFSIEPIPRMRRFSLDAGYLGRRRHIVHGLFEVDITRVRDLIRQHQAATGEKLSLTAYVIYCLGQAISKNPHMHAYRDWRNRLVMFDDIHITSMVEIESGGRKIPAAHIFKAVNRRSYLSIHQEIRSTKKDPEKTAEVDFMKWFLLLPAFLRRRFYWLVMRMPQRFRKYSSSVMVTAVGMFARGGGWAITMPNFTLTVAVGGIARKPGVVEDRIEIREYLDLTVSVDHDIVDGAPSARFANHFRELMESGQGLTGLSDAGSG